MSTEVWADPRPPKPTTNNKPQGVLFHPSPQGPASAAVDTLFGRLRSNRDRAIVAMGVSSAARPSELLGMAGADEDWGEQQIRVERKGTRAVQWLPVSAESLVWLRLYLVEVGEVGEVGAGDPLWQSLRRRDRGGGLARQPLSYESLRAVFRRLNAVLGTNWTLHDLRHTAAIRMSRDPRGWLGEVEGLKVSLAGAEDKLAQVVRRSGQRAVIGIGMPMIRSEGQ
ncbi:site-specific integrase [Amycolatopsis sp. NPDC004368]